MTELVLFTAHCHRDWPVILTAPIGRCKDCGVQPQITGPWVRL